MLFCKHLFWINLLLNIGFVYAKDYQIAGTPARLESEYKLPIKKLPDEFNLTKELQVVLFGLIYGKKLNAAKLINKKYFLSGRTNPYVFVDIYFDTSKNELMKNNSMYRLRYRWKNELEFNEFVLKPQIRNYPTRAEIQSKINIAYKKDYLFSANETRFEFRNSATPFSKKNPAPSSPWPLKQFLNYAQTGIFKDYKLAPYQVLEFDGFLNPELVLKTKRIRFHLNLPSKWGSGPNPTQAFIITIDQFSYKPFDKVITTFLGHFKKSFLEIEVELERNISTNLELSNDNDAKTLYSELKKDQKIIKDHIVKLLSKNNLLIKETGLTKYTRVLKDMHGTH